MKVISLVVFIVALVGSWYLVQKQPTIPESVHVGIQSDLKKIIGEFILKKLPNAKNLVFKKFWTETLKENKVKATFAYTFEDTNESSGNVGMTIEGYAILNKLSESPEEMEWSFDELHIQNSDVEFKDPIHISSKPDPEESANQ